MARYARENSYALSRETALRAFCVSGGAMLLDVHMGPDGERYVTRKQAAELKGVSSATIGTWMRKGYLAPVPGCQPRNQLFKLDDVDRAETTAYLAALRTSGSETRVQRNLAA